MASLYLGDEEFGELPEGWDDENGVWMAGQYWAKDYIVHDAVYDRRPVPVPGRDRVDIRKYGFRGRSITFCLVFIETTHGGVHHSVGLLRDVLENKLFDVTLPNGNVYTNCQLRGGGLADAPVNMTIDGMFAMEVAAAVESLDL